MPANTSSKKFTVYKLQDPETGDVRYVGITSKKLEYRLSQHIKDKKSNQHKKYWIENLLSRGFSPKIVCIKSDLSYESACGMEMFYIKKFKDEGFDLVNQTNGGEVVMYGKKHSDETKKKMSEKHTGKNNGFYGCKHSKETIERLSNSLKGRASWSKGKKFSKEHREKLSQSHKGVKIWNKGKSSYNLKLIIELLDSGKTQKEIAKLAGVINQSTISKIKSKFERGFYGG